MTLNGSLAGLVAITAGCDVVSNWEAILIGLIAGVFVVLVIEFVDKVLKVDDPVGAIGVHGACGLLGTVLTGIFGTGCSLLTQLIGVGSVLLYVLILAFIIFFVLKMCIRDSLCCTGMYGLESGCWVWRSFICTICMSP